MPALFKVSVIIPVYNREQFIQKAIESAHQLEDTGEIIIVDDGSSDNTFGICQKLKEKYAKIALYQHDDKKNHGISASRNLGIAKATCDYISFLDSDDFYLPNRFEKDKEILLNNTQIDGVYNALGIYYYTEKAKVNFYNAGYQYQEFLTVTDIIPPDELFFVLFNSHPKYKGDFSTITITVRKKIFDSVGVFDVKLKQKEDIHLWCRMAAMCNLASGIITEAVAIRGVHDNNTMVDFTIQPDVDSIWWTDLKKWLKVNYVKKSYIDCFSRQYLDYKIHHYSKLLALYSFLIFFIQYPKFIREQYGCFDIHFFYLFGEKKLSLKFISFKNRILGNH